MLAKSLSTRMRSKPGSWGRWRHLTRSAFARLSAWGMGENTGFWLSYVWALGTGLILVLSTFPHDILAGGALPDSRLNGDVAAHIAGQRAYIQDAWHWPLLTTTSLDWPAGLSVAMTDSIPLVALPLKLFSPWLPANTSAVLLWLAFAYLVQPVAAVFALRSAGECRVLPAIAISLFAIAMPTFLYRHPHSALSSHFLLLMALGSYFRTTRKLSGWFFLPASLPLLSLLVHPYLAFMTLAILAAAPLTLALRLDSRSWRAAGLLAVGISIMLLAAWCLGYAATNPSGGFGLNSMNLISPFYPSYSHFLGRYLPALDPTGAQYEGYQYLGTGLLLLTAITLLINLLSTRTIYLRRHFGLAVVCLVLTLLALSSTVYAGTHKIFDLHPIPPIFQQLRSSGRVFWPVSYVIMIGCVASISRLVPAPAGAVIVLSMALLQLRDSRDLCRIVAQDLRAVHPTPVDPTRLSVLLQAHSHLTILPTFGCGADANAPEFMQMILAATRLHVTSNTMYVARFATLPDCAMSAASEKPLLMNELRIFLPNYAHTAPFVVPGGKEFCRAFDSVSVCTLNKELLKDLPAVVTPTTQLGQNLLAGAVGSLSPLGPGWYLREPEGVWSIDNVASIVTRLYPLPAGAVELHADVQGFTGTHGKPQHIIISVNGTELSSTDVPDRENGVIQAEITQGLLVHGPQVVRFAIANPVRPSEVSKINDTRQLGLFLKSMRFDAIPLDEGSSKLDKAQNMNLGEMP